MNKWLMVIILLALLLRLFRVGEPVFKEDEFTTVKAAAYIYKCRHDFNRCQHRPTNAKNRFLALITANETIPNSAAEIYLWDFIKDRASQIHHSRAWPQLYLIAGVYRFLGINEFSSRLVSVVSGSLLVLAGYWLARSLGSSERKSLLYSFLLAIAFPLLDFSRNARMYSLYILVFSLLVGLIHRRRWWLSGVVFFLAYQLQMLTLILPVALLTQGMWPLLLGLVLAAGLTDYFSVDFFGRQFLGWVWPPHFNYLNWWWLASLVILWLKKQKYLLSIVGVYLIVLIFFTRPAPAGAYTIMLWPLVLWALLGWRRWLTVAVSVAVVVNFGLKIPYLYFNRDGRADIPAAYEALINNFQPGNKIYAVQLRDYYLQNLPEETPVVDLQQNPSPDFSGSGFVVWEQEKAVHFKPETLEYIRKNFQPLGSNGVEIYRFGK